MSENGLTLCKDCGWCPKSKISDQDIALNPSLKVELFCKRLNMKTLPNNYCKKGHRRVDNVQI